MFEILTANVACLTFGFLLGFYLFADLRRQYMRDELRNAAMVLEVIAAESGRDCDCEACGYYKGFIRRWK